MLWPLRLFGDGQRASDQRLGSVIVTLVLQQPGEVVDGETIFKLDLNPRLPGLQYYKIRLFPFHPALTHRYETGYMIWV